MNCLNCNKPLEQTPGKKAKQFCNVSCRSSYWQKQKRLAEKAPEAAKQEAITSIQPILTDAPLEWLPLVPQEVAPALISHTVIYPQKSFADYLKEAQTTRNPVEFVRTVMADKSLTPGQRDMIRAKIKPEKLK